VDQERWSRFHERIASAILAEECAITVDPRGRLIVVDDTPRSRSRDHDSDGFDETIVIGLEDAGVVVAGDPSAFYESVRAKVGDWGLLPAEIPAPTKQAEEAREPSSSEPVDVAEPESTVEDCP